MVSAFKRVEFVSVKTSYIVLSGCCLNIIVLNLLAQIEEKFCAVFRHNPRHMDQVRDFDFSLNQFSHSSPHTTPCSSDRFLTEPSGRALGTVQ